tara:strand:- start:119 stop:526 length:408 start_codon:yes stop_codon:yes gene_type:complete
MTEEQTSTMQWILGNMPMIAMLQGFLLIVIGLLFYLDSREYTALIPAIIGLGFLIPGYLAFSNESMKMHAMHATAVFALIGILGGAQKLPEALTADFSKSVIAHMALLILCGEYMFFSIMSFRAARIKRELEAGN